MKKERNNSIDIIRGCAILLVILHHIIYHVLFIYDKPIGGFLDSFSSVAMPLFFIISGYFYINKNEKKQLQTIKYIFGLYLIGILITLILQPETILYNGLINIITGRFIGDMWYIHHLLIFHLLVYSVKYNKRTLLVLNSIIFLLMTFFNPSVAYLYQIFPYLLGCLFAMTNMLEINTNNKKDIVSLLFATMIVSIILIPMFVGNRYNSSSVMIFVTTIIMISVAINTRYTKENVLSKIGKNSLDFYFAQYISWNLVNNEIISLSLQVQISHY